MRKVATAVKSMVFGIMVVLLLAPLTVSAAEGGNNECPVGLISGMSLDQEFGYGTQDLTQCIVRRNNVQVVVQLNQLYTYGSTTDPYGLENIENMINDYEVTDGIDPSQISIVAILHGKGGIMALNNNAAYPNAKVNPFQATVQDLMSKGVKFYLCQNTARHMNIKTDQLIPGIDYVTAGVTALIDFQYRGYKYVQP